MGSPGESSRHMDRRALLTDREREVLSGEVDDVENPAEYRSKIRSRIKKRLKRLESDVDLLDKHEPDLAEDLYKHICGDEQRRLAKVEREIAELRNRIEDED